MTKPVNNNSCCRHLKSAARQYCETHKEKQPVVGGPKIKALTGWEKFVQCRNNQVVHQLMVTRFDRAMAQVKKTSQSVAKSNGTLAGAIVFFAGAIGAVMNAADLMLTHERMQFQSAMRTARYERAKHQPLAQWKTLGRSRFVVVDPWQIDRMAESACRKKQDTETCVKKFKARTWKAIYGKAGRRPIVSLLIPPKNLLRVEFKKVPVSKK